MIIHVLSVDGFYFSATYDLTHTLQRLSNTSPEFQEMSLLERVRIHVLIFFSTSMKAVLFCSSNIKIKTPLECRSGLDSILQAPPPPLATPPIGCSAVTLVICE